MTGELLRASALAPADPPPAELRRMHDPLPFPDLLQRCPAYRAGGEAERMAVKLAVGPALATPSVTSHAVLTVDRR